MGGEGDSQMKRMGGDREIVEDFDGADSRTMFIHEEGKREKWSNYSSFMTERMTDKSTEKFNHVPIKKTFRQLKAHAHYQNRGRVIFFFKKTVLM